ncbi:MAG: DUF6206 family protein [Acidimicrobiales bacterium]
MAEGTGQAHRDAFLDEAPLAEVEAAVQDALARGSDEDLRVLGYGEITLVLGWPTEEPRWACKRLPAFDSFAAAHAYGDQLDRYLAVLAERGVDPAPSALRLVEGSARPVAYVVQPVLPASSLGPQVLRGGDDEAARRLLQQVVDVVPGVVDDRVGIDGQISNWALVDGELRYLDVSTPMLFDVAGRVVLDLDLFLAAYPWLLRAPIRRFVAPDVIGAYRDARHVLVDLVANLVKERLERWLPVALDLVNDAVVPAVTEDEVRAYYRSDARLWEVMLRLRRADRWWQRTVRRRTYPFLLPGPIER